MKPKALDLFCGAGGASMGLHRAGFEVVGVDHKPQPRYPFAFIQADALLPPVRLEDFDLIWASPPCQAFSAMQRSNVMRKDHPELIDETRELLAASRCQYVIENVPGAPLREPHLLCGQSFGLRVLRHRLFETSFWMMTPPHVTHARQNKVRGKHDPAALKKLRHIGFTTGSVMAAFKDAMDCHWMTPDEGRQAVPPAYAEFIGRAALRYIEPNPRTTAPLAAGERG